ncbi:MAG: CapA family protein [Mycobacteriaceae bacterium]|nr:CapA family protein [Mycobacteriaceae bacterium]
MTPRSLAAPLAALVAVLCTGVPVSSAAAVPPQVSLTFVGDMILGSTPNLPSNPTNYLAPVGKELRNRSDAVFANLEGTLTSNGPSKCPSGSGGTCYAFRNPPSFARAFASTGFAVLGMANNHSYDFGSTGLRSTQTAITNAGMSYTGMPGQITYLKRHGIRIAFVAFAPYGRTNNLLDTTAAARLIRKAHSQAPVVVVYMHAGAEGSSAAHVTGREEYFAGEDRGNPRRFAHLAIDNGASLVVASGPHVLRGAEFYHHHLIDYSLGNFANFHNFSSSGNLSRSAILHVTLSSKGAFVTAQLVSVRLDSAGRASLGGSSIGFVGSLSRADFGSAAAAISSTGRIRQP